MIDDEFEWDTAKAQINLTKHEVDFEAASCVFGDFFAVERPDDRERGTEVRHLIIGVANGVLLTVVYTERGDRTRIISAGKANRHEQREYYRSQTAD